MFETLRLFRSFYRDGYDPEELLRDLSLDEKRDARVGKLSGGQKQRLAVACALVGDPDVLFLDEPTTGLDPQSRLQLWDIVQRFRAKGGTVLLTTHYMEEAERLCDRVAIVDHGQLIALGTPAELIAKLEARNVIEFTSEPPLSQTIVTAIDACAGASAHRGGWLLRVAFAGRGRAAADRGGGEGRREARVAVDARSDARGSLRLADRKGASRCLRKRASGRRSSSSRSTRTKEFLRETEALFWVFGFPLILALALGFAFREKPPDRVPVGVVAGPNARSSVWPRCRSRRCSCRSIMSEQEARDALRRGKVSLLIEGDGHASSTASTPTRPDAQSARREADDALQTAAGRRDVVVTREERVHEQGARYIDFLIPGLLGMNLMGTGMWSMGFTIANARMKKLLKRLVATPMRKTDFLLAQFLSRLIWLLIEVTVLVVFGWLVFGVRVNGSILLLGHPLHHRRLQLLRHRPADRVARANDRSRQRPDEPHHDADVALLRRLLFLRTVSRLGEADHPLAAADVAQRRVARGHQ